MKKQKYQNTITVSKIQSVIRANTIMPDAYGNFILKRSVSYFRAEF